MTYVREDIGKKMYYVSFIAALSVVVIHSNTLEGLPGPAWAVWVGNAIGYLQHWAVPYFFVVAGFFFDRGYAATERPTSSFLKSKASTLLVPYLFWGCLWGALTLTPIKYLANLRHGMAWQGTVFAGQGWLSFVDSFLGLTRSAPPNPALWFVRLLLLFFLLAPVWRWARKHARLLIPLLGIGLIFFSRSLSEQFGVETFGGLEVCLSGVAYLLFGMTVSLYRLECVVVPKAIALLCFALWAFISCNAIETCNFSMLPIDGWIVLPLRISRTLLLVAVGAFLDEKRMHFFYAHISSRVVSLAFWIYCMHHPITSVVGIVGHLLLGRSLCADVVQMVFAAPLTISACILTGMALRAHHPSVYAFLTGGRPER